jgi:hypothetical protein
LKRFHASESMQERQNEVIICVCTRWRSQKFCEAPGKLSLSV